MKSLSSAKVNGRFAPFPQHWDARSVPVRNIATTQDIADFELSVDSASFSQPEILAAWHLLLAETSGPEKLYQKPEFFRYMEETSQQSNHELYIVRRRIDSRIVGILPVRRQTQDVAFRLGSVSLFTYRVAICQILGSVPLLDPGERGLEEFVYKALLAQRSDCAALAMQALPVERFGSLARCDTLSSYVLDGWRDCHVAPLPPNVDDYLQKFSAKKRYNLSRQVRLLAKEAGDVQVLRIDQMEQVDTLMAGLRAVAPADFLSSPGRGDRLASLTRNGLLLSYVIRCGIEDVAVVLGTRSDDTWHVHNIWVQPKYQRFSVGTSAVHLALLDVIEHHDLAQADFGYGTPNQEFRATHVLKSRGFVMIFRSHGTLAVVLKAHAIYDRLNVRLIRHAKQFRKVYEQYRRRQKRPAADAN